MWLNGDVRPSTRALTAILLAFWVHAAAQLGFFIMVALAVQRFETGEYLLLAGAWGIGASIGYLSIFSAGGLGVRDGVALALVGPALTGPVGATVVAVSRIILVLADLLFVATAELIHFLAASRTVGIGSPESQSASPETSGPELAIKEGS